MTVKNNYRFLNKHRIKQAAEFQAVFQSRLTASVGNFKAFAKPNQLNHPRLGLAITKRKARTAVQRNLIKRLVRESFRLNQAKLSKLDIVVVIHRQTDTIDNQSMTNWLDKLWEKLITSYGKS